MSGDASRRDAVKDCSDALRRMATNKGIEIEDAYRNIGGIFFSIGKHGVGISWRDDNKTGNETFF